MKEWRCFHCDEVFTDRQKAREHFGDMGFENGQVTWEKTTCEELAEVKRLCGDRYPDAMALNTIHQLRAEIKRWKEYVLQGDTERDQLRAELEDAKRENEALANLLWEHPTAPCDQDSVCESMKRVKELRAEVERLKETHIMQLAAISVAANSNTESTLKQALKCHPDYKTVALSVVVVAIQREIWERNQKDQLKAELGESACEVSRLSRLSERLKREIKMLRMHPNLLRERCDHLKSEVERCNCVILQSTIDRQDEKRELERLRKENDEARKLLVTRVEASQLDEAYKHRDQWRAVAEQACTLLKACLPDVPMGTSRTLAAYEKLKDGK